MTLLTLAAAAPFDFSRSLDFIGGFPATRGEQRVADGELVKAWRAAGRTVVARIAADGAAGVRCELYGDGPLDDRAIAATADRIGFYLGLDDDLAEFYALGRQDPVFAPIIDLLHGYHQVKFPSPVESLVWAILSQRTLMSVAAQNKRALADAVGNRLGVAGAEYLAFPDHDQLAGLPAGRLAELIGNERQARYLHGALRGWAEVDEEFLRTAPFAEVEDFLLGLPGVGAWSASFVLIRGLGRMDQVPIEKQLMRVAERTYGGPVNGERLRKLAAGYGRWQGYWAHYLRVAG